MVQIFIHYMNIIFNLILFNAIVLFELTVCSRLKNSKKSGKDCKGDKSLSSLENKTKKSKKFIKKLEYPSYT